jgi:hypothetical protein
MMNEQVPSKEYLPHVDHMTIALVIGGSGTESERSAVRNYILGLERTIAARATAEPNVSLTQMVDRFLAWPLPKSVCSDLCVTDSNYPSPRCGTNLLTADEARSMLEHVTRAASEPPAEPAPTDKPQPPTVVDGRVHYVDTAGRAHSIHPLDSSALAWEPYYRDLARWWEARAAQPPGAWRSALTDKPTEQDGPVVLVFTGDAYTTEYWNDVNAVEHIAWQRISAYTRPTKGANDAG